MVDNTPNQVHRKVGEEGWLLDALKQAMRVRKITMRQLSDRLDIPYRSIQNYTSGESRIPADVLLRICVEIGLEADFLARGTFELTHSDLQDAVLKVLGDVIPNLDIGTNGKAKVRTTPTKDRSEQLSVAHVLTTRLNAAYAAYREASFSGGIARPRTTSDVEKVTAKRKMPRPVGQ